MNDDEIIMQYTEYFTGKITAYVSKEHRCRQPEDVDPREFEKWAGPVKCWIADEQKTDA